MSRSGFNLEKYEYKGYDMLRRILHVVHKITLSDMQTVMKFVQTVVAVAGWQRRTTLLGKGDSHRAGTHIMYSRGNQ